jgi:hypothetical protein
MIEIASQKSPLAQKSSMQVPLFQKESAAPGWIARPRHRSSQLFSVEAQNFVEEYLHQYK